MLTGEEWVDLHGTDVTLTVTCRSCWTGLPVRLALERVGTPEAWLRADPADLTVVHLFAAAHRGPFTLGSDPLIEVETPILRT